MTKLSFCSSLLLAGDWLPSWLSGWLSGSLLAHPFFDCSSRPANSWSKSYLNQKATIFRR